MRRLFFRDFLALMGLVSLGANGALAEDTCADVLRSGIWEVRRDSGSTLSVQSFMNWFCSQEFQSEQQANRAGGSVSVPIKGIPVNVGGYSARSQWKQYYSSACSLDQGSFRYAAEFQSFHQEASKTIVTAWERCMSNKAGGLRGSLQTIDDPDIVHLHFRYDGTREGGDVPAQLNVSVKSGSAHLKCETGGLDKSSPFKGEIRDRGELSLVCMRQGRGGVIVSVNSQPKMTPPILQLKPFPPSVPDIDRDVTVGPLKTLLGWKVGDQLYVHGERTYGFKPGHTPRELACIKASDGYVLRRNSVELKWHSTLNHGCYVLCPNDAIGREARSSPVNASVCGGQALEREVCLHVRLSVNEGSQCEVTWELHGKETKDVAVGGRK